MDQKLSEMLSRIALVTIEQREVERDLKELKATKRKLELEAADYFAKQGIKSTSLPNGAVGTLKNFIYLNGSKDREALQAALLQSGLKHCLMLSAGTLKSWIKEQLAASIPGTMPADVLPEDVRAVVTIHQEDRVIVTGSGNVEEERTEDERSSDDDFPG